MNRKDNESVADAARKLKIEYKAPFGVQVLIFTFPVWWFYAYLCMLLAITTLATSRGVCLPILLTPTVLYVPFLVVPVLILPWLFVTQNWSRRILLIAVPLWLVLCSGLTQGALNMAFWTAMGSPINDSLANIEKRAPGMYLTNRCDQYMNQRASMVFEMMDELKADDPRCTNLVCRLIIFHSMSGPVECFSIYRSTASSGTIVLKEMPSEPSSSAWHSAGSLGHNYLKREQNLSQKSFDKLSSLLVSAKEFYEKNKYTSHWCISRKEHFVLEFKKGDKYYCYEVDGNEPDDVHAPTKAVLPDVFQALWAYCREAVR